MRTFYGDDTYAKAAKADQSHRIQIFGGVIVEESQERPLIEAIRQVKKKYTH